MCSLPQYTFQPTALAFHPSLPQLVVAYSDRRVRHSNGYFKDNYFKVKNTEKKCYDECVCLIFLAMSAAIG